MWARGLVGRGVLCGVWASGGAGGFVLCCSLRRVVASLVGWCVVVCWCCAWVRGGLAGGGRGSWLLVLTVLRVVWCVQLGGLARGCWVAVAWRAVCGFGVAFRRSRRLGLRALALAVASDGGCCRRRSAAGCTWWAGVVGLGCVVLARRWRLFAGEALGSSRRTLVRGAWLSLVRWLRAAGLGVALLSGVGGRWWGCALGCLRVRLRALLLWWGAYAGGAGGGLLGVLRVAMRCRALSRARSSLTCVAPRLVRREDSGDA